MMSMSARQALIRDISVSLKDLKKDISTKLVDGRKKEKRTPLDVHKLGVFNAVLSRAQKVTEKYSLALKPKDVSDLENNIVYIKWDGRELKYLLKNVIGESNSVETHEGVITIAELPKLAVIKFPLKDSDTIQPLCIDVLAILSGRNQIKFNVNDDSKKDKFAVLCAVMQQRGAEELNWMGRFKEMAESVNKQHFDDISSFEDLYMAVFHLYCNMSQQMFYLEQFATIENPEGVILEADDARKKLEAEILKATECNVDKIEKEYEEFSTLFDSLVKQIEGAPDLKPLAAVSPDLEALSALDESLNNQLRILQESQNIFASIRDKARWAAAAGDKPKTQQHLDEARAQIELINEVKNGIINVVNEYITQLRNRITGIINAKELGDGDIERLAKTVSDMRYLSNIVEMIMPKQGSNEFIMLQVHTKELVKQCQQRNSFMSDDWNAVAEKIDESSTVICAKLQNYIDQYMAQQQSINDADAALKEIREWQQKVLDISNEITPVLRAHSEALNYFPAYFAPYRIAYEELIQSINVSKIMLFIRSYGLQIAAAAILLSVATGLIAAFVMSASIMAVVVATSIAFTIGMVAGVSAGLAVEKHNVVTGTVQDVKFPKRGSSADVLSVTGYGKNGDDVELAEIPAKAEGLNEASQRVSVTNEIEIDMDALNASIAAAGGTLDSIPARVSNNPFDGY